MRLRISKECWDNFLRQDKKSLPERSLPSSDHLRNHLLILVTPYEPQGWNIFLTSSATRGNFKGWLLTKALLMDLSSTEKFLLEYLTAGDESWIHFLVDKSLDFSIKRIHKIRLLEYLYLQDDIPGRHRFSRRFLSSFQPSLEIFKVWMEKKRIPAKRFVGIGYLDHGSLGSGPSWKEQMLEERDQPDIAGRVLTLFEFVTQGVLPGTRRRNSSLVGE